MGREPPDLLLKGLPCAVPDERAWDSGDGQIGSESQF